MIKIFDADLENLYESLPQSIWEVKGQLSKHDRLLYYWIASHCYQGKGTVVDAGALVGATTKIICEGLRVNKNIDSDIVESVHVYDLFQDDCDGYSAKVIKGWYGEASNRSSIYDWEHIFLRNLEGNHHYINLHKGDIAKHPYADQRKIEILSIDVAKTPKLMIDVARDFFPHLTPDALILHQDYLFPFQPYLHVAMEMLADYFEKIYDTPTNCTSVFRLVKPVSAEDVTRILGKKDVDYYYLENAKYLNQAIKKADTHFGKIMLTAALSYFYLNMGKRDAAILVAERMLDQFDVSLEFLERSDLYNLFVYQLGVDYMQYYRAKKSAPSATFLKLRSVAKSVHKKAKAVMFSR